MHNRTWCCEQTNSGSYGYGLCSITIVNDSNVAFTYESLAAYLYEKGYNASNKLYTMAHGSFNDTLNTKNILGVYSGSGTGINSLITGDAQSTSVGSLYNGAVDTFIDTILSL